LKLGIRLKAGAITRRYDARSDDKFGTPRSTREKKPKIDIGIRGTVLPGVVKTVNISALGDLYALHGLSEEQYIALVRASRMYQDALWIAESEPALAWLMFVSSLETAANQWSSEQDTPAERLKALKPKLTDMLLESGGDELIKKVENEIIHSLGATTKFINFVYNLRQARQKRGRSSGLG